MKNILSVSVIIMIIFVILIGSIYVYWSLQVPVPVFIIKDYKADFFALDDLSNKIFYPSIDVPALDKFNIKMLYPTKKTGRSWYSNWSDHHERQLKSGDRDPFDNEFISRGNGVTYIDGRGIASIQGESPRMYVYDDQKEKKWDNVEVTVYVKRILESGIKSSQGIVIGARSEHQDATKENPCLGQAYYGRLLYDGRAVFQKEVVHEGAYSVNKPEENNKAIWDTADGSMPRDQWIGVKFIVRTNFDVKSVKLELYRDLTDGVNGGVWEKVSEYNDNGDWFQTRSGVDVMAVCGHAANKVLLGPGTSVFIRNDAIKYAEYKLFSIREIE